MFKLKKFALILSLLMTLSIAPTNIFADGNSAVPTAEAEISKDASQSSNAETSAAKIKNSEEPQAAEEYNIEVHDGTATVDNQTVNKAASGKTVTITANNAPAGKEFEKWTGDGVIFANATDKTTTFTMLNKDVTITANYKDKEYTITVNSGTATVDNQTVNKAISGKTVTITANNAPAGKEFEKWTGDGVTFTNATDKTTTFTMPTNAVTITANYKDKASVKKDITFSGVKVYNTYVEGYAKNATEVKLVKNGTTIATDKTIGTNGEFTIDHTFVYNDGRYYGYGREVYPNVYGYGNDASGYDYVVAVRNGSVENYAPVSSSGRYDFKNSLNYNVNSYTFYATNYKDYWYYDRDYRYGRYNLSEYKLVAKNADGEKTYSLDDANDYRNGYYWYGDSYYKYDYTKAAYITSADANSYTVKGYGTDSYAKITVKDSNGYTLGTATSDYRGDFTVTTNRALKYGEVITVYTSSSKYYRDNYTKYTVGGSKVTTNATYSNEFKIDSKSLTISKNGITTTRTMDVAPYIKDGRTMLPLRYVAESLGYNVLWNPTTRIASFSDENTIILVNIDSTEFVINGKKYNFSVKPEIKNDRINLPVAEIGKALGLSTGNKGEGKNIEWDSVNRTVKITVK